MYCRYMVVSKMNMLHQLYSLTLGKGDSEANFEQEGNFVFQKVLLICLSKRINLIDF